MQLHPYGAASPLKDRVECHPVVDIAHLCSTKIIDRAPECDSGGGTPSTLVEIEVVYRRWDDEVRILSSGSRALRLVLEAVTAAAGSKPVDTVELEAPCLAERTQEPGALSAEATP